MYARAVLIAVALGTALPAYALFEDDDARAQIKKLEARGIIRERERLFRAGRHQ